MKILIAHNRYQIPGGEDTVVANETALLRAHGLEVELFSVDNDAITTPRQKAAAAIEVTYSWPMRRRMEQAIAAFRPDLVHVHNFFPRLSPSIYDAAAEACCPVVQTLHNYRLLCLNGTLFRDGHVCRECLGHAVPLPGVRHRCYRGSLPGSASVALMLAVNRLRGAWSERVDRYLLLTPFAMQLFAEHSGIPLAKMRLKPNAATDLGEGSGEGGYALYAGRLSAEKGIGTLLAAASLGLGMPLKIAGQGPLLPDVEAAHAAGKIDYLGALRPAALALHMRAAACLVLPSLWYEGLPMVVPEAYSAGLPVVASEIGSLASLIEHERTGLLFAPGDAQALADACHRIADEPLGAEMRVHARARYCASYRPGANYALLRAIYEEVIAERAGKSEAYAAASDSYPALALPVSHIGAGEPIKSLAGPE